MKILQLLLLFTDIRFYLWRIGSFHVKSTTKFLVSIQMFVKLSTHVNTNHIKTHAKFLFPSTTTHFRLQTVRTTRRHGNLPAHL